MRYLAYLVLLAAATPVLGERYIVIHRTNAIGSSIQPHDFQIGTSALGSSTVTPLFAGTVNTLSSPELVLRNQMMPEEGIIGIGKRAWREHPRSSGFPQAIMVTHSDNVQFWAASDAGSWRLIPSGDCVNFNFDESPTGQLSFNFCDDGSNGNLHLAGSTPAVSEWGLLAMLLGIVAYATIRILRDAQQKAVVG